MPELIQMNLYDYLFDEDPLLQKIKKLGQGDSFKLKVSDDYLEISMNFLGIFEVSNEDMHECFSRLNDCYVFVKDFVSEHQVQNASGGAI